MSVRFKFRSAVNFDSVDIEGRPSLSVRDLRAKIVRHKNLNLCHDFDLVFSDAVTGQEYVDENFQIPSGSSIIIKRIPAGSVPSPAMACIDSIKHVGNKDADPVPENLEIDDFDDFGIDLCPIPQTSFCDSDVDIDKLNCSGGEIKPSALPRCSKPPAIVCQKLESSDLSEASPRVFGSTCKVQGNTPQTKTKPKVEECRVLEKGVHANPQATQNVDLPSEMRCSLCNTYFKKAVMIPCCQHSFCEQCIRRVLVEKAQCPKCSSTKCRVENLLPNLSLRQAIDHFLESQMLLSCSDDAFHRYAPDGESGIQANDFSFAGTILQKDLDLPHSPTATGQGSNFILTESAYDSTSRNNVSTGMGGSRRFDSATGTSFKSAPLSQKIKQKGGENDDFQGENIPTNLCKSRVPGEDDSTLKKKEFWVNKSGGGQSVMPNNGRSKKGDRACYNCGSPDHLMRDCPTAQSQNAMLQTGAMYPGFVAGLSPYWNGIPSPYCRPPVNMYGNPGMMPFNATMVPVTPFAVPTYVPSMYCGLHVNGGYMGTRGLAPPVETSAEQPLTHPEFLEAQDYRKKQKLLHQNMARDEDENLNKWQGYNDADRAHGHKPHIAREKSISNSEDSSSQRFKRKKENRHNRHIDDEIHCGDERHDKNSHPFVGRDRKTHHSERSSLEIDGMPHSCSWHSEDRHKSHHESSKKHNYQRGQCSNDSSRDHHHTKHQKDDETHLKKHREKHRIHSRCSEKGSDTRPTKQVKERDPRHCSGHDRRHHSKATNNDHGHDRWMAEESDHDYRDEHPHHKRKRVH